MHVWCATALVGMSLAAVIGADKKTLANIIMAGRSEVMTSQWYCFEEAFIYCMFAFISFLKIGEK